MNIKQLREFIKQVQKEVMQERYDFLLDEPSTLNEEMLEEGVYDPGILKAVFTAGGPGSGKSYVADLMFDVRDPGGKKKFNAALSRNYLAASQLLTGWFNKAGDRQDGFLNKLDNTLDTILRKPDGLIPSKKNGLRSQIGSIDRRISDRERILDRKEQSLKQRYSRLEETIAKLKAQGNSLGQMGAGAAAVPQLG